ncbi:MAG: sigma-54-dependent transcriptional regulator [Planctomycetota bacterium]|jgi:DNA-binding NtrC family response regulator
MARILVIDDEPGICRAFEKYFGQEGHLVRVSSRAETGLTLATAFEPDVVILDVRLPGMDGLEALKRLKSKDPDVPVVVVTAYGTMETAVEAMQRGAYDYILKPLDLAKTSEVLERAIESRRLSDDVAIGRPAKPRRDPEPAPRRFGAQGFVPLIGRTPVMQEVFKRIGAVSLTDAPVLVAGESGTGKEMAARAVHYSSARSGGPFEPVSCGAVPEALLTAELFGTESRPGRLDRAKGGTLFLDEVSELAAPAQVELLRLLEEGEPDARVVAATDVDLSAAVAAGRFREDLFYKLNVAAISMPALRERMADVPHLVARFLAGEEGPRGAISKDALRTLLTYRWPGNVRELRSAVEHSLVLARGGTILPEHLPEHVREGARRRPEEEDELIREIIAGALEGDVPDGEVFGTVMDRFERPLVAEVLARTGGNQVQAARILGIHRTTLRSKIKKYGL